MTFLNRLFGIKDTPPINNLKSNIKVTLLIQKHGKEIRKPMPEEMFRALYDLQFMLDDVWNTLEVNKKSKSIREFFDNVAEVIDCYDDGKCYQLKNSKLVPIKEKHYHSGKPPIWKSKKR